MGMNRAHTCLKRDEVIKLIGTGRGFLLGGISHIIQLAVRVCRGKQTHTWNHQEENLHPQAKGGFGRRDSGGTGPPVCTHRCLQPSGRASAPRHPTSTRGARQCLWLLPATNPTRPPLLRWGRLLDSSLPLHALHSFSQLLPYLRFLHPLILLPEGFNPAVGRECMGRVCDSQVPWERRGRQAAAPRRLLLPRPRTSGASAQAGAKTGGLQRESFKINSSSHPKPPSAASLAALPARKAARIPRAPSSNS